jgi:hypothetical protein
VRSVRIGIPCRLILGLEDSLGSRLCGGAAEREGERLVLCVESVGREARQLGEVVEHLPGMTTWRWLSCVSITLVCPVAYGV